MYAIETKDYYGQWSREIGDENLFHSQSAAARCIRQLRGLGPDWAAGTYRIVEVPAEPLHENE